MNKKLNVAWWQAGTRFALFVGMLAIAATFAFQHAGQLEQGEQNRVATAAASEKLVTEIKLAAATQCPNLGALPATSINRAFGITTAGAYGISFYRGDQDRSSTGFVNYEQQLNGIHILAVAQGACATHSRRLGGVSPWLAGTIGVGFGLLFRLGVLGLLMLAPGLVSLGVARTVSEAVGGFVAGFFTQILSTGRVSWKSFVAGGFGALSSSLGGYASRAVIARLTRVPAQAAQALHDVVGDGDNFVAQAADYVADGLNGTQAEWQRVVNEFMAMHP